MKPMSDKEFDGTFKQALGDLEIAPSAHLWDEIAHQLPQKNIKKSKSSFAWMAAASIIMVCGLAFLLFRKENEVIRLHRNSPRIEDEVVAVQISPVKKISTAKMQNSKIKVAVNNTPEISNEERFLALIGKDKASLEKENLHELATFPGQNHVLATKVELNNAPAFSSAKSKSYIVNSDVTENEKVPILAYHQITEENNDFEKKSAENTKIKSVGDLVNFVIAKVDKRENKLLYISKTEESDMEITGINLGLFKYKKN